MTDYWHDRTMNMQRKKQTKDKLFVVKCYFRVGWTIGREKKKPETVRKIHSLKQKYMPPISTATSSSARAFYPDITSCLLPNPLVWLTANHKPFKLSEVHCWLCSEAEDRETQTNSTAGETVGDNHPQFKCNSCTLLLLLFLVLLLDYYSYWLVFLLLLLSKLIVYPTQINNAILNCRKKKVRKKGGRIKSSKAVF